MGFFPVDRGSPENTASFFLLALAGLSAKITSLAGNVSAGVRSVIYVEVLPGMIRCLLIPCAAGDPAGGFGGAPRRPKAVWKTGLIVACN